MSRRLALLASWLRVIYATLFVTALGDLLTALRLVDGVRAASGPAHGGSGAAAGVLDAVTAFQKGWTITLALFGLHLLVVAWLVLRSSYMPSWLSVLVAIAGLGYLVDGVGTVLLAGYGRGIAGVYLRRGGAAHGLAAVARPADDHPAAQLTQPLPSGRPDS